MHVPARILRNFQQEIRKSAATQTVEQKDSHAYQPNQQPSH